VNADDSMICIDCDWKMFRALLITEDSSRAVCRSVLFSEIKRQNGFYYKRKD